MKIINHFTFQKVRLLLFFAVILLSQSFRSNAQITVKFKPDSTIGKDVEIGTSYGCKASGYPSPFEMINNGANSESKIFDWTISALGCTRSTARSLIKFTQLSSIPASATIIDAKLNLFCVNSSINWGTSQFPGSPYPLSNPGWVERVTGTWDEHLVTWNTQPTSTTTNRAIIPTSAARWGWSTSIDVTTMVNDIRSSGINEGFLLKLQTEAYYRATIFASSDHVDSTLWPELVITYSDPCGGTDADFKDTNSSCYTFDFTDLSIAKDSGIVTRNWDFGDGATSTVKNPSHTYSTYGTYNVRLIVSDSSGCIDTFSKVVTINYTHFANAGRDTTLCLLNGTATTFLVGNTGAKTYAWTPVAGLSNSSSSSTYANLSVPTIYYLSETDTFGCRDRDTVFVNLYPKAVVKATPKDTSVCAGTFVQLNATGAKSYEWSPATNLNFDNIANPYLKVTSAAEYVVKGTNNNGCIGFDTVKVALESSVIINAQPKNSYGCKDDKIQLNVSGAAYYKWTPSEGLSNDSIANPIATISKNQTYYVTGKSIAGCEGYDSVVLGLYPNPIVDAYSIENFIKCRGNSIRLNVTGASSYEWQPAEYCDNNKSANPMVSPMRTTLFTVTGKNDNGCIATDTISVIFEGEAVAYLPNTFSPNGDGINDKFGVVDNCNFQFYSMRIYDRWGELLFTTLNQFDKWDGSYKGKQCNLGVYFYMLKGADLEGNEVMKSGDFTLMR